MSKDFASKSPRGSADPWSEDALFAGLMEYWRPTALGGVSEPGASIEKAPGTVGRPQTASRDPVGAAPSPRGDASRGRSKNWLWVLSFLLLVAVGGWFVYQDGGFSGTFLRSGSGERVIGIATDPVPMSADGFVTPGLGLATPTATRTAGMASTSTPSASPTPAPTFTLSPHTTFTATPATATLTPRPAVRLIADGYQLNDSGEGRDIVILRALLKVTGSLPNSNVTLQTNLPTGWQTISEGPSVTAQGILVDTIQVPEGVTDIPIELVLESSVPYSTTQPTYPITMAVTSTAGLSAGQSFELEAVWNVKLQGAPLIEIASVKSTTGDVAAGDSFSLELHVANLGKVELHDLHISLGLPSAFRWTGCTDVEVRESNGQVEISEIVFPVDPKLGQRAILLCSMTLTPQAPIGDSGDLGIDLVVSATTLDGVSVREEKTVKPALRIFIRGKVRSGTVYVRDAPVSGGIVGWLYPGAPIEILASNADRSWYRIRSLEGRLSAVEGPLWMSAYYTQLDFPNLAGFIPEEDG